MNSFSIYTPTRILFGEDQLVPFAEKAAELGKHALVVLGGGTVERLGFLQPLTAELENRGVRLSYFRGIEPNPEATTINRATAEARAAGVDFVLAFGGGSVMDAGKAIAALLKSGEEDIWPFVQGEALAFTLNAAIPIVAVPTTAATASEVTPYSVISHRENGGKAVLAGEYLKPLLAWLNPTFTLGLSDTVTRDGAADILSHVFEGYFLGGNASPLADRYSEGVMATVLETLPRLLRDGQDRDARANLLWASNLALNDYQKAGLPATEFVLHAIEHSLSAKHPELAHGRGLATLYPAYFRWLSAHGRGQDRMAQAASRVFGAQATAEAFIERLEGWLEQNGLLQSLEDLGFSASEYGPIADYAVQVYGDGQQLNALGALTREQIVEIFELTARQSRATALR